MDNLKTELNHEPNPKSTAYFARSWTWTVFEPQNHQRRATSVTRASNNHNATGQISNFDTSVHSLNLGWKNEERGIGNPASLQIQLHKKKEKMLNKKMEAESLFFSVNQRNSSSNRTTRSNT